MDNDTPATRRMEQAGTRFVHARADLIVARDDVHDAIPAAILDGMKVSRLVELTGYNRERIRTIARAAGVHGPAGHPRNTCKASASSTGDTPPS